jgi:hypothetical protein
MRGKPPPGMARVRAPTSTSTPPTARTTPPSPRAPSPARPRSAPALLGSPEAVEHGPVGLDGNGGAVVDHQGAGIFHAQEAVLGVSAEQLRRCPAEPVRFGAVLVEEGERVLAHRFPIRWEQVPARRGVLGQALDLVAPGGDGGREVGHVGRGRAERLLKRKSSVGISRRPYCVAGG